MITYLRSIREELKFTSQQLGIMIIFLISMLFLSVWFTGAYYNEYVNDVKIAVLDEDQSSMSRKIINYFDDNERFTVAYYVNSKAELQQLIDERKVYMGLYIPKDLHSDILTGQETQVLVLVDTSNVIIGNNVYAGAASIVQTVSAGAAIQVVEAKGSLPELTANNMVVPISFNERMLYDPKMTYSNYLMYGFVAIFLQQMMLSSIATLLLRNAEEVAASHTFAKIAAKITVAATFLIGTGAFAIFVMHNKFNIICVGDLKVALLMSILFAIAICVPGIFLAGIVKNKIKFSQISYMLSLPTFLTCGYIWPVDQMPPLLAKIARVVWPLMNFARPFDEIMVKGLPFSVTSQNALYLVIYSIVLMPLAILFFKKRFTVNVEKAQDAIECIGEI